MRHIDHPSFRGGRYRVNVTWQMTGFVDVDAIGGEEMAIEKVLMMKEPPNNGVFIPGSLQVGKHSVQEYNVVATLHKKTYDVRVYLIVDGAPSTEEIVELARKEFMDKEIKMEPGDTISYSYI